MLLPCGVHQILSTLTSFFTHVHSNRNATQTKKMLKKKKREKQNKTPDEIIIFIK